MSSKSFFSDLPWLGKSLTVVLSLSILITVILAVFTSTVGETFISHLFYLAALIVGFLLVFVTFIQLNYRFNWSGQPIILKPLHSQNPTVALIFIQGEGIPIERYQPIAEAIQKAASNLAIWVAIPRFIGDSPIPRETGLVTTQALRQLTQAGMPTTDNVFFIAHSVGGIAIQKYLNNFPEQARGQVLMGSFLGKWNLSSLDDQGKTIIQYEVPTLTIGGTLDGLARITRIAAAVWYQQINPSKPTDPEQFPVVAISGASHMQFASGEATSYVADFDLKPTASESAVHTQVGEFVHHFIQTKLSPADITSQIWLQQKQSATLKWIQPLIDAFLLEGYNGFKPACYDRAEDNTRCDPQCTPYSPWVQNAANQIMAGADVAPEKFDLKVIDSFHRSYTTDPFHKPHVHVPQIRNSCNGVEPCTLTISSVTQALYTLMDALDTGFFPIAAFSLRTKLNSRQNIWKQAGVTDPNFEQTDGASRGAEINQQVYEWALSQAELQVRGYFEQIGTPIKMGEDLAPIVSAGPLWIWNYPKYDYVEDQGNSLYQVRSTVMKTPITYPIASARGFHYCQLLSPAAAMEWIYIDGLRLNGSLAGTTFTYGPLAGIDKILRYLLRGVSRQTRTKGLLTRL